ncbi:hypothetical protein ACGFW5_15515 [Streptomyces sp. NPDC048416]|uniref:hypothetical protein n=1 Tax=Streptomyces sp. NPDC048416 TaxID=3365546 RepID=UPI00371D20D3
MRATRRTCRTLRTRRTLRTAVAAVVTGAVAALALPAGAAFAGSPTVAPRAQTSDESRTRDGAGDGGVGGEGPVKITMPDGRTAKLISAANGPRVEISLPDGGLLGAINRKDPSALNDGWTYKLVDGGKGAQRFVVIDGQNGGDSWVYDFKGKLIEKYTAQEGVEKP